MIVEQPLNIYLIVPKETFQKAFISGHGTHLFLEKSFWLYVEDLYSIRHNYTFLSSLFKNEA